MWRVWMDTSFGETLANPVHSQFTKLWVHFLFQAPLFLLPYWGSYENKILQQYLQFPSSEIWRSSKFEYNNGFCPWYCYN